MKIRLPTGKLQCSGLSERFEIKIQAKEAIPSAKDK